MLWVLPGCRGIDIGSCWYLPEFPGVFIALLQTLHHLPMGVSSWLCSGMSPNGTLHILTPGSPGGAGGPSVLLTVPSKLWGQLCPHLPSSLWVSGHWAAKLGAWLSAFRYAFSHSSLPLWKLLWLGNRTYISILTYISKPLWLTYASIFNLSWPEEILDLFELSSAKWLRRSPGERNFRNLRSSHIFLIQPLPYSIVLLHYPWCWTFPLLPFRFANLSFIQGTHIELTWLFIQSWLSPSLLLCPWTQHPESQQKQCLSSPPQPEKKCHFSSISIMCVVCHFFQHPVQSCLALCLDKLQWITPIDHRPDLPVLFHLLHNGFWVLPAQPHLSWSPLHVLPLEVATQLPPVAMQRLSISFQIRYGEKYLN